MGWENITDRLTSGDLENIPVGTYVNREFLNSFFKAFRERIAVATRSNYNEDDFDELLFDEQDGSDINQYTGIAAPELHSRLITFNSIVASMFGVQQSNGLTLWLTDEYINQITTGDSVYGFGNIENFIPFSYLHGGNLGEQYWNEDQIKDLLTEEVYDSITNQSSKDYDSKFTQTKYWSGLYKLLKYVFKHSEAQYNDNTNTGKLLIETTEDTITTNQSLIRMQGVREDSTNPNPPVSLTPSQFINQFIQDAEDNSSTSTPGLTTTEQIQNFRLSTEDEYRTSGSDYSIKADYSGRWSEVNGIVRVDTPNTVNVYYVLDRRREGGLFNRETSQQTSGAFSEVTKYSIGNEVREERATTNNISSEPITYAYTPSEEAFAFRATPHWVQVIQENVGVFVPETEEDNAHTLIDYSKIKDSVQDIKDEGAFNNANATTIFESTQLEDVISVFDAIVSLVQSELEFPAE